MVYGIFTSTFGGFVGVLWYMYLHVWLIFVVNVGKYASFMDGMDVFTFYGKCRYIPQSHGSYKWVNSPSWIIFGYFLLVISLFQILVLGHS